MTKWIHAPLFFIMLMFIIYWNHSVLDFWLLYELLIESFEIPRNIFELQIKNLPQKQSLHVYELITTYHFFFSRDI